MRRTYGHKLIAVIILTLGEGGQEGRWSFRHGNLGIEFHGHRLCKKPSPYNNNKIIIIIIIIIITNTNKNIYQDAVSVENPARVPIATRRRFTCSNLRPIKRIFESFRGMKKRDAEKARERERERDRGRGGVGLSSPQMREGIKTNHPTPKSVNHPLAFSPLVFYTKTGQLYSTRPVFLTRKDIMS